MPTPDQPRPLASVVIPMMNEERDIEAAIEAVARQTVGAEHLELILVDGGSVDATIAVATRAADQWSWSAFTIVDNAGGNTPSNLNAGLAAATSDVLVRVDARSLIGPNHVERCIEGLVDACVVGGRQIAIPNGTSIQARGIARALNNRFAMGGASYRDHRSKSGPVDTVYLGTFSTEPLRSVGGWDEQMSTNQDFDLNRRMAAETGLPVWFDAEIRTEYIGRPTVRQIFWQYHRFGRWKVRYWNSKGARPEPRQWALIVVPPVAASMGAGLCAAVGVPLRLATAAGSLGLAAVEHSGTREPEGGLAVRAVSTVTVAAIGAGWWTGVARGVVTSALRPGR